MNGYIEKHPEIWIIGKRNQYIGDELYKTKLQIIFHMTYCIVIGSVLIIQDTNNGEVHISRLIACIEKFAFVIPHIEI